MRQEASTSSPTAPAVRRIGPAIVAALVLLASRLPAQASRDGGDRPLVTDVSLRGVRRVDVNALRQGLVTKPTQCKTLLYLPICWVSRSPLFTTRRYFDAEEFRRDVLRIRIYYWRRGWRDATVAARTERASGGMRVIFDVEENEPTIMEELSVVQADTALPQRAIDRALQVGDGDPLDLVALDSSVMLLRDELWERGHAEAQITLDTSAVSDTLNRARVRILVEPGPLVRVAAIQVAGNQKVSDRTVRRLLTFQRGDLFRRSLILDSQRNLYLSGMFAELEVETPPAGDNQRIVHLRITEGDLNRLDVAGGFSTADFIQLETEFTRYNWVGGARRLTLRATVSNLLAEALNGQGVFYDVTDGASGVARDRFLRPNWSTSVDVVQPWFLSPYNQLGFSIFSHRRAVPGIVVERGVGATAALTHDFAPRSNTTVGYTYESGRVDAEDVYFCVAFGTCLSGTIDVLRNRNVLAPVASVTQIDVTNDPFTPDRGYRARLDVEHASALTASDFRYNRGEMTGSTYFSVSRQSVLAARIRLGWVQALRGTNRALNLAGDAEQRVIHPRKRFYAGGAQSVRGFGERQLGPRVLTVSPAALTDTALTDPCTTAEIANRSCNPNLEGVPASAFQPQPLGGSSVAEASVEYRFPLFPAHGVSGAVFLDGAVVGANQLSGLVGATGSVTPGFGVRLDTPVGPVRLDLGIRPTLVERLPVITEVTLPDSSVQLVTLNARRRYDPLDRSGGWLRGILSRLRLHLAIGPPF